MNAPYLTGKSMLAGVYGMARFTFKVTRLHGYWLREHAIDGAYLPFICKSRKD